MIVEHGFVWIFFTGNQRDNCPIHIHIQNSWHVFVYYGTKCLDFNKGWHVFVYYGTKCLDFNKGWTGLGYLGLEHNENGR